MKKFHWGGILYYIVLLGGFALFLGFLAIGYVYYVDEIQNIFDTYPYIVVAILIMYFVGYLYALKKVVSTKAFKKWESESKKNAINNRDRNRIRYKRLLIVFGLLLAMLVFICFYMLYIALSGLSEPIPQLGIWCGSTSMCVVVYVTMVYLYNKS